MDDLTSLSNARHKRCLKYVSYKATKSSVWRLKGISNLFFSQHIILITYLHLLSHNVIVFISAWERYDFSQLFPTVPCDAISQVALQGGGNQDSPLDIHKVLPGPALGRPLNHPHLLHLRGGGDAGEQPG